MIALVCVLAYLAAALLGARHLYSRLRARAIDKRAAENANTHARYDSVAEFNEYDRPPYVVGSVLGAVFWPVALAGYAVYRFVTANPAMSRTELAAERDAMAKRIRELENELGIKETPASDLTEAIKEYAQRSATELSTPESRDRAVNDLLDVIRRNQGDPRE